MLSVPFQFSLVLPSSLVFNPSQYTLYCHSRADLKSGIFKDSWMSEMAEIWANELFRLPCTLSWFQWRDLVLHLKVWTAKCGLKSYSAPTSFPMVLLVLFDFVVEHCWVAQFPQGNLRENPLCLNVSQSSLKEEIPVRESTIVIIGTFSLAFIMKY